MAKYRIMQGITIRGDIDNSGGRGIGTNFKLSRNNKELTNIVNANIENWKKAIDRIALVLEWASS